MMSSHRIARERPSQPFLIPNPAEWAGLRWPYSDSQTTLPLQGAGAALNRWLSKLERISGFSISGANFMHKPSQALLRRYAIDSRGVIHFIESVLAPGQFLASRLDYLGQPLDSKMVTFKELKTMTMHNELRSARALSAVNYFRNNPDARETQWNRI